jgi:hypothetical protein
MLRTGDLVGQNVDAAVFMRSPSRTLSNSSRMVVGWSFLVKWIRRFPEMDASSQCLPAGSGFPACGCGTVFTFLKFGISESPGFIRSPPPLENANPTFVIMIELIFLSHLES